ALARNRGRRRERHPASRSRNRRGPGDTRHAGGSGRLRTRGRWPRSVLLRRRKKRQGARGAAAATNGGSDQVSLKLTAPRSSELPYDRTAMRILLTNSTLADRSGSELYLRDLAIALRKRDHHSIAYTPLLG